MIYKLVSPASVIFVDSDVRRGEEGARLSAWLGARDFLTENSNNILQSSVNLLLKQKEQRIINAFI